jgi:hypothetical protein
MSVPQSVGYLNAEEIADDVLTEVLPVRPYRSGARGPRCSPLLWALAMHCLVDIVGEGSELLRKSPIGQCHERPASSLAGRLTLRLLLRPLIRHFVSCP